MNNEQNKNALMLQQAIELMPDNVRDQFVSNALKLMREASTPFRKLMAYYTCAMMEVETKLNVLNEEFSLQYDRNPISSIKTRLKSFGSIVEKLQRKGISLSDPDAMEAKLNDIAGVRVVCSFPEDVYMLADALLKQDDIRLIQKKDYIKNPKPNGYRSLHLILEVPIFLTKEKKMMRVEVQFRTIAMDFWASLEHKLKYKKDIENAEVISQDLYFCAELISQLDGRMQQIRRRLEEKKEI